MNNQCAAIAISEKTRQRVLDVAEELGYRRNEVARSMATGKTRLIGFLAPSIETEFIGKILQGSLDLAEEKHFSIKIVRIPPNAPPHALARQWTESRLAGLICNSLDPVFLEAIHAELTRFNMPTVTVANSFPQPGGMRIVSDDQQGIRLATEHLAGLGHSKIAFISGAPGLPSEKCRSEGYLQAMKTLNLAVPSDFLKYGHWEKEQEEDAARAMLSLPNRPTAIICASDLTAMAVFKVARQLGLHVPRDLSVIGFGNMIASQYTDPALTTIDQPFDEMGRTAMRCLLEQIDSDKNPFSDQAPTRSLPTRLIIRDSTAPARGKG